MKNRKQKLKQLPLMTFTARDAKSVRLDFYDIQVLVKSEDLVKIKRGIYQKTSFEDFENENLYAALAHFGKMSVICLRSAIFYYGLSDEIPDQVWVYVPLNKNSHNSSYKVIRKRDPKWHIGILENDDLRITDVHRTVVDALSDKKHFSESESMKIAKQALKEKVTTLDKLSKMAKNLGVFERIRFMLTLLQDEHA